MLLISFISSHLFDFLITLLFCFTTLMPLDAFGRDAIAAYYIAAMPRDVFVIFRCFALPGVLYCL